MKPLALFTVFHLNIAYSSIEEALRPSVIRQCYWPMLRLAAQCSAPLGIEASGYTLETIAELDPDWLAEFRRLITGEHCELIGSGYAQLIGPLVPAEVNRANQLLGIKTYEHLLGVRPAIALVNEQAYSAGLIEHYIAAGYQAIIMEWENAAENHPEWCADWRYSPQLACDQHGGEILLLWNSSIAFQKFQRYAHGEFELDEYLAYLAGHLGGSRRVFALYGNDAEIFDFRPGRLHTEPPLERRTEWQRIRSLAETIQRDDRFRLVLPRQAITQGGDSHSTHRLSLESAAAPIPVKKQDKYNITRWAVTGRADLDINTACWRIYEQMRRRADTTESEWRELCYLWSSDFRTHITPSRWEQYCDRLAAFERRWRSTLTHAAGQSATPRHHMSDSDLRSLTLALKPEAQAKVVKRMSFACASGFNQTRCLRSPAAACEAKPPAASGPHVSQPTVRRAQHRLTIETDSVQLCLNTRRGLAIERLTFKSTSDDRVICGTLPHGYFESISLANDYYSGHVVAEVPGRHKVTDLSRVEPRVEHDAGRSSLRVEAVIPTPLGPIAKQITVSVNEARIELAYRLEWPQMPPASLRLGYVTLVPESFDRDRLFFRTHQGGTRAESFRIPPHQAFDHGSAVSTLVTARQALALTDGIAELGDDRCGVRVQSDQSLATLVAMIQYRPVADTFLCRLCFSAGEVDDTRMLKEQHPLSEPLEVRLALSPLVAGVARSATSSEWAANSAEGHAPLEAHTRV